MHRRQFCLRDQATPQTVDQNHHSRGFHISGIEKAAGIFQDARDKRRMDRCAAPNETIEQVPRHIRTSREVASLPSVAGAAAPKGTLQESQGNSFGGNRRQENRSFDTQGAHRGTLLASLTYKLI